MGTALIGNWHRALWETGYLPVTALGALKAEVRTIHRQLVPLWRRRTRHGRVLSLDAALGDGLSLYDLVAADVDVLDQVTATDFTDQRIQAMLHNLNVAERQVVLAYAYGEGGTWTEAAAVAGITEPEAFGERMRRKTPTARRRTGPPCRTATPRTVCTSFLRRSVSELADLSL
ncbi:hypothetical protein [Streptomyces ortus]|uniref:Sigma-70 family RNA polymerase sigma factor n=1 Tax=Streptomyces ortus TaxID=2867268 RepID=A0ABT3V073_9ACTN|nr:hypothetical protein [Streptomyces ortus]MCX4231796.1 hypothetical protein [Streptomyces ortus]